MFVRIQKHWKKSLHLRIVLWCNFSSIQIENSATIPLSQFTKTQRNIILYNSFTDYIKQIQKNQTKTTEPNRSNDQTFMLDTIATTVPTLSRCPLAPLIAADTYSLSSTNNTLFQTNTNINATASPWQTLYQPHTHLIKVLLPLYFHHVRL